MVWLSRNGKGGSYFDFALVNACALMCTDLYVKGIE